MARQFGLQVGVLAAALAFYAALALGASIFGSYRYEPSGVQYAFLPLLVAPLFAAAGGILAWLGSRIAGGWVMSILPFAAALTAAALPSISLADSVLETGRWLLVAIGVLHAGLLLRAVWKFRSVALSNRVDG
jgi:hypothetical protein